MQNSQVLPEYFPPGKGTATPSADLTMTDTQTATKKASKAELRRGLAEMSEVMVREQGLVKWRQATIPDRFLVRESAVNFPSVSHAFDGDDQNGVVDRVNNSIIPDTNAKSTFAAFQFAAAIWAGFRCKPIHSLEYAALCGLIEFPHVLFR